MPRLLGHLAQFSAFSKQGELLCTQALAYLLRHPSASEAFKTHFGIGALGALEWHAERMQQDRGRPDLEGCASNDKPVIKIEGKLGALLSEGQLQSYVADFDARGSSGMLLVLVPRYRLDEARSLSTRAFGLTGPGPSWVLAERNGCVVRVACWDEIIDVLTAVSPAPFGDDLVQFNDLYRALNGDLVEPLAAFASWREREAQYLTLVDKATRYVAPQNGPMNPIGVDVTADPRSYKRRYVCRPHADRPTCFSLGLIDPFPGAPDTPVWLRFHKDTGDFSGIRGRLQESNFWSRTVQHDGHLWLPVEVPGDETDGHVLAQTIAAECSAILRIACPDLTRAT